MPPTGGKWNGLETDRSGILDPALSAYFSPIPHMTRPLLPCFLFSAASLMAAVAQDPIQVPPDLVGGWKLDAGETVVTFLFDGSYYLVDGHGPRPGMERGFIGVDEDTGAFHADVLVDTNGDAGLSHPLGDADISVTGDTLTYTVAGEGSFTFTRVKHATRPEVGSWFIPAEKCMVTLLADGSYYMCQEANDAPYSYAGGERGKYLWNPATKSFIANAVVDTNGDIGLSHQSPDLMLDISGNRMTMQEGLEQFSFQRIQGNAGLSIDNDFEVNKFTYHTQGSTAAPVVDGYGGAAYLHGINGSGGTLTIGSQAARTLVGDDYEQEFPSLAALDGVAGFQNGVNHVLQRSGGSATLVFPNGSTAANAPAVTGGSGEWDGGIYQLASGDLLEWTPFENYNPETDVTVITVTQAGEEDYLYEHAMQGDVTSFDFEGRLEAGQNYEVTVEHVRLAATTGSGTGLFSGKLGYAILGSHTAFTMQAHEETSITTPVISEPVAVTNVNANSVILTVGTVQDGVTHQWQQDGEDIDGQTGNSLALYGMTPDDYGTYRVLVTNQAGTTPSNQVTISALPAVPEITVSQPSTTLLSALSLSGFGIQELGGNTDLEFTVRNTGTQPLGGISAFITGTDAGQFSVQAAPAGSLAGGAATTFTVRFSPDATGLKDAVLRIQSDDGDENPFLVVLAGTSTDPVSQPDPPAPPVVNPSSGRPEQTVTVSNAGAAGMSGVQLRINGVPDGVTVVGGTYVAGGGSSGNRVTKAPGGYWLLDYTPVIGAGGSADIVVQYEFTGAPVVFTPTVAVAPVPAAGPADPAFQQAVKGVSANLATGRSTINVRTVAGRRYQVSHSQNLTTWQNAGEAIFSRGTALTWTDDGSATGTAPSSSLPRFYRVLDVTE